MTTSQNGNMSEPLEGTIDVDLPCKHVLADQDVSLELDDVVHESTPMLRMCT